MEEVKNNLILTDKEIKLEEMKNAANSVYGMMGNSYYDNILLRPRGGGKIYGMYNSFIRTELKKRINTIKRYAYIINN